MIKRWSFRRHDACATGANIQTPVALLPKKTLRLKLKHKPQARAVDAAVWATGQREFGGLPLALRLSEGLGIDRAPAALFIAAADQEVPPSGPRCTNVHSMERNERLLPGGMPDVDAAEFLQMAVLECESGPAPAGILLPYLRTRKNRTRHYFCPEASHVITNDDVWTEGSQRAPCSVICRDDRGVYLT